MLVNPLVEVDDIDKLFNTDDLNVDAPVTSVAKTTSEKQLKEQVRRVVKDPAALQELCQMFSSQGISIRLLISLASCKEFMEIKEKIALAIIKEEKDTIEALVAEAKIKELCDESELQ
jgi:glycine cleavage system regulatory protein